MFLPLNPSTTTVYVRSTFYPSLRFTLSLQSAFYTQSAFYPWSAVRSPQSPVYTERICNALFAPGGGGGVLPYIGHIGMRAKGYGFLAVLA